MAFGIGTNTEPTEAGVIKGKQETVACDCWFTSSGKTIPRFLKYQDAEGVIHKMYDIKVHASNKRNYCGIAMIEYECSCEEQGQEYRFRFLFQPQECQWVFRLKHTLGYRMN